jgi:hypothetical protein
MPGKTGLTIAIPTPTAPPPTALHTPIVPIFIYTPQSLIQSDIKPPPSPTSSLKACFVRSRPTSTDFSDYEYSFNDFSGLGNGDSDGVASSVSSGTTSPPSSASASAIPGSQEFMDQVTLATEQWARAQLVERDEDRPLPSANSDARSVAMSTLTATSRHTVVVPVRIVRRSDAELDKEVSKIARETKAVEVKKEVDESKGVKGKDDSKRRRTWPSYKAIRRTVSNIVHRKETPARSTPAPPPTPPIAVVTPAIQSIIIEPERIKSSSASLFSRRRRRTTVSNDSDTASTRTTSRPSFIQRALSTSSRTPSAYTPELQHRAQLRRSRSFSGFTTVLSAIVDAEQEQDEDMDEVTAEAKNVVEDIGRRWAFEEMMEVEEGEDEHAGYLFERCVE